jgi:2',3'-cyclic-nucleotide 2'-phosphodiesterase/3'-nucleotidase
LAIQKRGDPRYEQESWSFINPSYNFDSAAGLVYTVDLNLPKGRRVSIKSLADGTGFDLKEEYSVAMTSYRASGGGGLLIKGAGILKQNLTERVIGRHQDIRGCVRELIERNGAIDASLLSGSELGSWEFINRQETLATDYELLFSP